MTSPLGGILTAFWGGGVAVVFLRSVRASTARAIRGRANRIGGPWARPTGVAGALTLPMLWGGSVIAALLGFEVTRRLLLRWEVRHGP